MRVSVHVAFGTHSLPTSLSAHRAPITGWICLRVLSYTPKHFRLSSIWTHLGPVTQPAVEFSPDSLSQRHLISAKEAIFHSFGQTQLDLV